MRIKYVFCNEEVEIEVPEEWGDIILDMDREEKNNNKAESRRHCSLDALDLDGDNIPSSEDLEADYLEKEELQQLRNAMMQLSPRQQRLIRQVYFEGKKYTVIAAEEGVDRSAIKYATLRAIKKMRKIWRRPSRFAILVG